MYNLHETNWTVRAGLFRVAIRRAPYGEKNKKLEAVARQFDIEKHQAWKEIQALGILEQHEDVVTPASLVPSPDVVLLAEKSGDAEAALTLYVDRKMTNPRYSRNEYREDLKQGADSMSPPPDWCREPCAACGAVHVHLKGER